MPEYVIRIPEPFPQQREVIEHPAKRKVIRAGRRFGKTTMAAIAAVHALLQGRRVIYATPTQTQSDAFWRYVKFWLHEPIRRGDFTKDENRRLIIAAPTERPDAGMLQCRTAWDADTMRGGAADMLLLDEFALMDVSAWNEVGAPMMAETDGTAWFISTPRRRNHFYHIWLRAQRAMENGDNRWMAWHFSSEANPHLHQDAIQGLKEDITQDAYRQEMLAEFLDDESAAFRNIDACLVKTKDLPEAHFGHRLIAGIDWGRQNDYTCVSIICHTCNREVARDRFRHVDFSYQRQRITALLLEWDVAVAWIEVNAAGQPIIDEMGRQRELRHIRIEPFYTTLATKPRLIDKLRLALEQEQCQFYDDPVWTEELRRYEMHVNPRTGHPIFSAPSGMNDDTVIARALAWWGAGYRKGAFIG